MSKRKSAYQTYLASAHWKALRAEAFARDGHKCVKCGSNKALQGHHLRYSKDFRATPLKWVQTLCLDCHERLHREKSAERKANRRERKQFSHLAWLVGAFSAA
jgi:5-methylcytosine-specific restriction endonuclease McrA